MPLPISGTLPRRTAWTGSFSDPTVYSRLPRRLARPVPRPPAPPLRRAALGGPGTCPTLHPSRLPRPRSARAGADPRGTPHGPLPGPSSLPAAREGWRARTRTSRVPGRAGAQAEGRLAARGASQLVVSEPGRIQASAPASPLHGQGPGVWRQSRDVAPGPRSPGPVQCEHTPPPAQLTRRAHAGRFPPRTGRAQAQRSRARPYRPAAARTGPPLPPGTARAGARSTFFVCGARAPPPPGAPPPPARLPRRVRLPARHVPPPRPPRTRPANEARRRRAGPGVLSAPRPPIGRALHPAGPGRQARGAGRAARGEGPRAAGGQPRGQASGSARVVRCPRSRALSRRRRPPTPAGPGLRARRRRPGRAPIPRTRGIPDGDPPGEGPKEKDEEEGRPHRGPGNGARLPCWMRWG